MFSNPKVSNIKTIDKKPGVIVTNDKELNAKLRELVMLKYIPVKMSFDLENVSNAVSNAIRRTISCELVIKSLNADIASWSTNDVFPISELVLKRLRMIPLDQSVPLTATYKLEITNNTTELRDIKSGEIQVMNGPKLPFNTTFTICTLAAGKTLTISDIYVQETVSYVEGNGMNSIASGVISVATDVDPINWYEELSAEVCDKNPYRNQELINGTYTTGLPSSIANPRNWRISFLTNGTMEPHAIVAAACKNIIERIRRVEDLLDTIVNISGEYILNIEGESHTIGNLFMRTICDMYQDIQFVVYKTNSFRRAVTIRVKTTEDIDVIYKSVIKYLISAFTYIEDQFSK